jgi:hypothetical protein
MPFSAGCIKGCFGLTSGIRRADQTTGGGLLVQDQVLHRRKSAVSPESRMLRFARMSALLSE